MVDKQNAQIINKYLSQYVTKTQLRIFILNNCIILQIIRWTPHHNLKKNSS